MVEEVGGISDLPPCKEIINLRMVCVCLIATVYVCVYVRALSSIKNVSCCYPGPNTFSVLMNSARQLQAPSLPNRISEVTNQKQKLRNDVIHFLEGRQLAWQRSEVVGVGEGFVKALVDTLWYMDGHHHVLKNRSHEVPESLQHFTGYNVPESSKHRKRKVQNLSEGTIREFSNTLFTCLQSTYWERSGWKDLKLDIQSVATLLSDYATYLREQNKKAKNICSLLHTQSVPLLTI